MLSYALWAHGFAFHGTDPAAALESLRQGLAIAQESGNRGNETTLAASVSRLEAEYGDPLAALNYLMVGIRNLHDAGNTTLIHATLAILAALFDRLGRHEPAATIAGFAFSPITAAISPEINTAIAHLRDVLGDPAYESLARKGETMTIAAIATYAYDQIDQTRTELNDVSE
jgi:hypothetical protein